MSCVSTAACMAIGRYSPDGSSVGQTLAESWDGTRWTMVPVPRPGVDALASVSCTAASACTAVGYAGPAMGEATTLIESWNGTAWSVLPSPSPGSAGSYLEGVSCVSATTCTAAGYGYPSAQQPRVNSLIETGTANRHPARRS